MKKAGSQFLGHIQNKGNKIGQLDGDNYYALKKEHIKFLQENGIRYRKMGTFGNYGYRLSFRKIEDMNFFLLVFNQYFECIG